MKDKDVKLDALLGNGTFKRPVWMLFTEADTWRLKEKYIDVVDARGLASHPGEPRGTCLVGLKCRLKRYLEAFAGVHRHDLP